MTGWHCMLRATPTVHCGCADQNCPPWSPLHTGPFVLASPCSSPESSAWPGLGRKHSRPSGSRVQGSVTQIP